RSAGEAEEEGAEKRTVGVALSGHVGDPGLWQRAGQAQEETAAARAPHPAGGKERQADLQAPEVNSYSWCIASFCCCSRAASRRVRATRSTCAWTWARGGRKGTRASW